MVCSNEGKCRINVRSGLPASHVFFLLWLLRGDQKSWATTLRSLLAPEFIARTSNIIHTLSTLFNHGDSPSSPVQATEAGSEPGGARAGRRSRTSTRGSYKDPVQRCRHWLGPRACRNCLTGRSRPQEPFAPPQQPSRSHRSFRKTTIPFLQPHRRGRVRPERHYQGILRWQGYDRIAARHSLSSGGGVQSKSSDKMFSEHQRTWREYLDDSLLTGQLKQIGDW